MAASDNRRQDVIDETLLGRLMPLNPRNFTSLKRTPWAGSALAGGIKKHFVNSPAQKIGESWEISCDPDAYSTLANDPGVTLRDLISRFPVMALSGDLVSAGRTECDILVKLLNADSPLSLQIHPSDSHPALKHDECGKPESWLVLSCAPGSGLYLGFKNPMTPGTVKTHLENNSFTSDMLEFVPVKPGDFFEIDPHVPHAIGPGVVLLEPQRIMPGKSGKTWRMWDWNRRYNDSGDVDHTHGRPRELHVKESLSILDPERQFGAAYVDSLRRTAEVQSPLPGVTVRVFPANQWYQVLVATLEPHSRVTLTSSCAFACVTATSGAGVSRHLNGHLCDLREGQSFFAPYDSLPMDFMTRGESLEICLVVPAGRGVINHAGAVFR